MKTLLFFTAFFSGLMAGLLYAYSCSVNPGLKTLPNAEYIKAMQAINAAIQNPLFFASFTGALLLLPVSCFRLHQQHSAALPLMAFAALLYFTGVFGVTVFGNVPLNNQLAAFPLATATAGETAVLRQAFEKPWNNYHTVRTIAAAGSFGLTLLSLLKKM